MWRLRAGLFCSDDSSGIAASSCSPRRREKGRFVTIVLLLPKPEVQSKLQTQIERARTELLGQTILRKDDLARVEMALTRWREYTADPLRSLFSEEGPAESFSEEVRHVWMGGGSLDESIRDFHDDIEAYVNRLQTLLERVELAKEAQGVGDLPHI